MIKLSTVIITLNEEHQIGRCLESVIPISDEVLVVDSYSTDKTEQIVKKFGVKFIRNKFEGHIEQKNFGIQKASYHHILSLDADEALDSQAQNQIKQIKNNWTNDSYSINRLTNYCGKWIRHCGWYPDRKIRLFDKRKAWWGGTNPHDKIILDENASTKEIKGDILHYSFPTIASHVRTANNFSEIAAKAELKKGKKIYFVIHVILNPFYTFLKKYFLQLGFLDGFYGFVICVLSASSNFLKYSKIWSAKRENTHLKNR